MARTATSIRRKLAADVAGYSRLMSLDEAGTVRALSEARKLFDQLISEYDGRIANTAGDSVLAEFSSALRITTSTSSLSVGTSRGVAQGRYKRPSTSLADLERFKAISTLMRLGWSSEDPTFRQMLTFQLIPGATKEQAQAFNELQRGSLSAESASRYYDAVSNIDIEHLLPQVKVPTLVLHFREDLMQPIEEGRRMAALIPGSRFVSLPGKNHLPLQNDPGMPQFFEEVSHFLSDVGLSKRRDAWGVTTLRRFGTASKR